LCYALILRHTQNQTYRNILNALNPTLIDSDLITQHGGVESFEIGLYGCSEMVNEGFRALVQQGVVRRRVSEDSAMMERINANKATPDDNERLAKNGKYLHGAFYLGSPEFYQWVREQGQQHNTLGMQRVSQVNSVTGEHYHLEKEQRLYPRFINTCMMATPFGGAVSDTLPDGRVVSGVGGQYNFVSMGFNLPNARSMLLLRAVRQQGQQQISNIRWTLGNVTVPRHLRDLLITEYGIADLRYATDAECVKRVLAITDESAVDELIAEAVSSLKLSPNNTSEKSELSGQLAADNNADQIVNALAPFRQSGDLLDYPLGSDFTDTEQRLVRALSLLKTAMSSKKDMLSMLTKAVFAKKVDSEAIARMGLANPKSVKEHLYQRLLNVALAQTSD
ncbi:MAG: acetyl-CoA hydrolase/transferase C-terminal domain-containing protein, partial [Oleibacter sp.]|nr:acetyl-CoA hydrolase/transferase C-terminal domain-containing protein [Thalassolituus sp.]